MWKLCKLNVSVSLAPSHSLSVSLSLSHSCLSALEIRLQIERIICSATAFWQRDTPPLPSSLLSLPSLALLSWPCLHNGLTHTHTQTLAVTTVPISWSHRSASPPPCSGTPAPPGVQYSAGFQLHIMVEREREKKLDLRCFFTSLYFYVALPPCPATFSQHTR